MDWDLIVYMIQRTAVALLDILEIAFFLRAILSWLPLDENVFTEILYRITEPIVYPFRVLFYKLNWFQSFPLDVSFLFAIIVLTVLRTMLSVF